MKQLLTVLAILILLPAWGTAQEDILTTASANGSFKTLTSLVVAADLDDALQESGDFTVFAPTDEAFAALPDGVLQSLLAQEGRKDLANILKYHVLPKRISVPETNPHPLKSAKTLTGEKVNFDRKGSLVKINESRIVLRNIECSNGLIHVIDAVLLPPVKRNSLVDVADSAGSFKILLKAAKAAGLVDALTGDGPLTVFAPTDEAFASLPKGTLKSLLKSENRAQLEQILKYHVVAGRVTAEDAVRVGVAETLAGPSVKISIKNGRLVINESQVVNNDVAADNGIIHVIDRVLLPPERSSDSHSTTSNADSNSQPGGEAPNEVLITSDWDSPVNRDGIVADKITIKVGGAGSVRLTNVEAKEIVTSISGGGSVSITGAVGEHQARVSGGAVLRARDLVSESTTVRVNGGGTAEVNATKDLDAKAFAGAKIGYVKTDAEITRAINKYADFVEIH